MSFENVKSQECTLRTLLKIFLFPCTLLFHPDDMHTEIESMIVLWDSPCECSTGCVSHFATSFRTLLIFTVNHLTCSTSLVPFSLDLLCPDLVL